MLRQKTFLRIGLLTLFFGVQPYIGFCQTPNQDLSNNNNYHNSTGDADPDPTAPVAPVTQNTGGTGQVSGSDIPANNQAVQSPSQLSTTPGAVPGTSNSGASDMAGNVGATAVKSAEQIAVQNVLSQAAQSYQSGNPAAAVQQIQTALQTYPNNLQLQKQLADIELIPKGLANQANTAANQARQSITGATGTDQLPIPAASQQGVNLGGISPRGVVNPQAMAAPRPAPFAEANRLLNEAARLINLANYARADEILNEAIHKYPTDARAYQKRADLRVLEGDWEGAKEDAAGALNIRNTDVAMLNILAKALVELGEIKDAQDALRKSFEQSKINADAFRIQADVWKKLGDQDKMLADLKAAAHLEPLRFQQDYDEAKDAKDALDAARRREHPIASRMSNLINWLGWPAAVLFALAGLGMLGLAALAALGWLRKQGILAEPATLAVRRNGALNGNGAPDMDGFMAADLKPGSWLADTFKVIKPLGQGGMGQVYLVYDKNLDRNAALKRMRPDLSATNGRREEFLKRFMKEAQKVAALDAHPNVVHIYHVLSLPGEIALVFEYVEGETLGQMLERKTRLSFTEALKYLRPVCGALDYAHERGIIHRDIKPSNIMVSKDGAVKVMDFGIARETRNAATRTNTVMGTPPYMAPEMERGLVGREGDVYSLGATLYELLSGAAPFSGMSAGEKISMRFRPLTSFVAGLPLGIDEFIAYALKPEPADRIQSVDKFLAGLEQLTRAPKAIPAKDFSEIPKIRGITPYRGAA